MAGIEGCDVRVDEEGGIVLDANAPGEEGRVAREMVTLPTHEGLGMAEKMCDGVPGLTRRRVIVSLNGRTGDGKEHGHRVVFSPETTW